MRQFMVWGLRVLGLRENSLTPFSMAILHGFALEYLSLPKKNLHLFLQYAGRLELPLIKLARGALEE